MALGSFGGSVDGDALEVSGGGVRWMECWWRPCLATRKEMYEADGWNQVY